MIADFIHALRDREVLLARTSENAARYASDEHRVSTSGSGEIAVEEEIDFAAHYIEVPQFHYGYSLDGDTLVEGSWPRCYGFVHDWRTDVHGQYVGAWVAIIVDSGWTDYDIEHHLSFTGIAMKEIPAYLLDE